MNRGTVTPVCVCVYEHGANILLPSPKVGQSTSFIDRYFSLQLQTKYKCEDSASEPETQEVEKSYQLSCFISQGIGPVKKDKSGFKRSFSIYLDVKYLHTGLLKVWFDVCWHGISGGISGFGRNC